jgi:hypothetical protein
MGPRTGVMEGEVRPECALSASWTGEKTRNGQERGHLTTME